MLNEVLFAPVQDNMVATNARVLFLWRQWVWGLCFASHEEAFYLEDLQVRAGDAAVWTQRWPAMANP